MSTEREKRLNRERQKRFQEKRRKREIEAGARKPPAETVLTERARAEAKASSGLEDLIAAELAEVDKILGR